MEGFVCQTKHIDLPNFYHEGGNEAGAYLQFIIDYYDCLPEVGLRICHQLQVLLVLVARRGNVITLKSELVTLPDKVMRTRQAICV